MCKKNRAKKLIILCAIFFEIFFDFQKKFQKNFLKKNSNFIFDFSLSIPNIFCKFIAAIIEMQLKF